MYFYVKKNVILSYIHSLFAFIVQFDIGDSYNVCLSWLDWNAV